MGVQRTPVQHTSCPALITKELIIKDITEFSGENRWLSNFWPTPDVFMFGLKFPTTEHAYQAARVPSEKRHLFLGISPGQAKRLPKKLGYEKGCSMWAERKLDVMRELIQQKFAKGTELGKKLQATGYCEIIEGNTWGDVYWGVCKGRGENNLGKLLMVQRDALNSSINLSRSLP